MGRGLGAGNTGVLTFNALRLLQGLHDGLNRRNVGVENSLALSLCFFQYSGICRPRRPWQRGAHRRQSSGTCQLQETTTVKSSHKVHVPVN